MASSNVTSVVNHFSQAAEGFTTTLGSSILSGAVTVPLNSTAGLTNGSIFVGIIEPGTALKEQTFTGTVDTGGAQITGVVWTRGTNTSHASGVTIVDYVTGTSHNMTTKGILVHSDQDGTLKAGAVDAAAVLANNVVTTAKILDGSVTNAKLATTTGEPGGAWESWTPTWTNLTVGNGVNASTYKVVGNTVHFKLKFTLGTTSSVGTGVIFSLPVASISYGSGYSAVIGQAAFRDDSGPTNLPGFVWWVSTTTAEPDVMNATSTYLAGNGLASNVPYIWATSDVIQAMGMYEKP